MARSLKTLNARGYDPDRPVPWHLTDRATGQKHHYTYKYERHTEEKEKREHRHQHALLWTKTQPATASDEAADAAGIGNWVIIADETAQYARELGHQVIRQGTHLVNTEEYFALLQQLQFVLLPRDLQGATDREEGIKAGIYLDLPITSVRVIRLRVNSLERKIHNKKYFLVTDSAKDTVRRALKILGCGTNSVTTQGNTTTYDTHYCNTKSCGHSVCSLKNYFIKRSRNRKNLKAIFNAAVQHQEQYRLVHATFATDWALPRNEPTRTKGAPILDTSGRKARALRAATHDTMSTADSMLNSRLNQHLDTMRQAIQAATRDKTIISAQHRVTELAFLQSHHEGRRSFPNPHTHAVIAVPIGVSHEQLKDKLLAHVRKIQPNAYIKLKDLYYQTQEEREEQASKLGAYDAKEQAITPAQSSMDYTISEEETKFMERLGLNWQPHCTELPAVLDDKSLAEVLEEEDAAEQHALYYSDVKDITLKGQKHQVLVVHMNPLTKPLGKDKGKPTHTRRLIMFFNRYKNKVTKTRIEMSDVRAVSAHRPESLRPMSLESDGLGAVRAVGLESDELGAVRPMSLGSENLRAVGLGFQVEESEAGNKDEVRSCGVGSYGVAPLTSARLNHFMYEATL